MRAAAGYKSLEIDGWGSYLSKDCLNVGTNDPSLSLQTPLLQPTVLATHCHASAQRRTRITTRGLLLLVLRYLALLLSGSSSDMRRYTAAQQRWSGMSL